MQHSKIQVQQVVRASSLWDNERGCSSARLSSWGPAWCCCCWAEVGTTGVTVGVETWIQSAVMQPWAHTSSICLRKWFTLLLHTQQNTVFANCTKERQHQPQQDLGYDVTWGDLQQHSGLQMFAKIFHVLALLALLAFSDYQGFPCNTDDDKLSQTGCDWAIMMIWSKLWKVTVCTVLDTSDPTKQPFQMSQASLLLGATFCFDSVTASITKIRSN